VTSLEVDVLVVGGGPGGYTAAARCAEYGLRTALAEQSKLGGTCLNVGCIPSKALIHLADQQATLRGDGLARLGLSASAAPVDWPMAMAWKDDVVSRLGGGVGSLLAGAGVQVISGRAEVRDGKTVVVSTADGPLTVTTRHLVIASGSEPVEVPELPFGGPVVSSTGVLSLPALPESVAVVGAGYVGLELGTAFAKLGSRVTVIDSADGVLPDYDRLLVRPVVRRLASLGVTLQLGTRVVGAHPARPGVTVQPAAGDEQLIDADVVLVAVGRRPVTTGWGLERLALDGYERFIAIDDRCRTSMADVYAVGDVTGEPMLAHRAIAQGELVADVIAGSRRRWDVGAMPAVCFTDPEVVSVGVTAACAASLGVEAVAGVAALGGNGRAMTLDRGDGLVQVVARADDRRVIGIHACGDRVSELAGGFAIALETACTLDDLCLIVAPHPTLSEALHDAARRALLATRRHA
jgi:dihydrolipoamide dehydrogenase